MLRKEGVSRREEVSKGRWLIAVLAPLACYPPHAPPDDPNPDRDYVVDIVMNAYRAPASMPGPSVRFHPPDLTCGGTARQYPGEGCVRGWYTPPGDVIDIVTWQGAYPYQESIAHEVLHWYLFKTTGNSNPGHAGNFYAMVEYANHFVWEQTQ